MSAKVKLFLVSLVFLCCIPLSAWQKDIGDGSGGGSCSSSCAVQCANGYWSSIGCLEGQCAHCPCGNPPYPYCT
jgi:hypothetical protein